MMTRPIFRAARHEGRMAVIAHRLQGAQSPENPFGPATKRARYWQLGASDAQRLVDQLLDLAPTSPHHG